MSLLLLTTPAQHQAENPAVELDEKRLQKWLDALPIMNVIETVKLLHQAITPFNELILSNTQRIKLLEHYRETIDEIFYSYDDMRLKQLPISNEQRKAIKADIMWLYLELANGYKIAIKNAIEEGHIPKKDSLLLLAIYRAMEQIIHALVNAFRNYETPPPLAYLELNQLYLVVEQDGSENKRISSAKRETTVASIANLYKQFMLLAVSDPFSMNEDDAFNVFVMLEQHAQRCEITSQPTDAKGIYCIDLADDSLPVAYNPASAQPLSPDTRYIDVTAAVEESRLRINKLQTSSQGLADTQEIKLLRVFADHAGQGRQKRVHSRQQSQKQIMVSFGIAATNFFMTGDNYHAHQFASKESFGIEVRDMESEDEVDFDLDSWVIEDISNSGRMLLAPKRYSIQEATVGMLVGLYEELAEGQEMVITIGTIRWQQSEQEGGKKIGIQVIPGRPVAVDCHMAGEESPLKCLHVPAVDVLKVPASLVIPSEAYEKGKELEFVSDTQRNKVRLGTVIEQSPYLVQCQYQPV